MTKLISTSRKPLFRIALLCDGGLLHQIMSLADRNAYDLQVAAVKAPEQEHQQITNGHVPGGKMVAREFVKQFATAHAEFTSTEAVEAAAEFGLGRGNLLGALSQAVSKFKIIKRKGSGHYVSKIYQSGQMLALPAPNGSKPSNGNGSAASSLGEHELGSLTNIDYIIHLMKHAGGPVTGKALRAAFKAAKRNPNSIDGAVGKLREQKKIKTSGARGTYVLNH